MSVGMPEKHTVPMGRAEMSLGAGIAHRVLCSLCSLGLLTKQPFLSSEYLEGLFLNRPYILPRHSAFISCSFLSLFQTGGSLYQGLFQGHCDKLDTFAHRMIVKDPQSYNECAEVSPKSYRTSKKGEALRFQGRALRCN